MKRSPGTRKTSANLPEPIRRQLNMYALAASAAGVGVLALSQANEAEIIYTPVHERIVHYINLDVNSDDIADFRIQCSAFFNTSSYKCIGTNYRPPNPENSLWIKPLNGRNAVWSKSKTPFVSAVAKGKRIGGKGTFPASDYIMAKCIVFSSSVCTGPWLKVSGRDLGLKFVIKSKIHYGWARLNVDWAEGKAILTGYAYETIPHKAIITGKTKGPDVITVQPATLGELALGRK